MTTVKLFYGPSFFDISNSPFLLIEDPCSKGPKTSLGFFAGIYLTNYFQIDSKFGMGIGHMVGYMSRVQELARVYRQDI